MEDTAVQVVAPTDDHGGRSEQAVGLLYLAVGELLELFEVGVLDIVPQHIFVGFLVDDIAVKLDLDDAARL